MFYVATVFECVIGNQFAALQSLQKRIVQIARETRPFSDAFVKSRANRTRSLFHPEVVNEPQKNESGKQARNSEYGCLVPGRSDGKSERSAFFVPQSVVIGGDHPKAV